MPKTTTPKTPKKTPRLTAREIAHEIARYRIEASFELITDATGQTYPDDPPYGWHDLVDAVKREGPVTDTDKADYYYSQNLDAAYLLGIAVGKVLAGGVR